VYWLESVPGVWQGASDDHTHGVIKVAAPHLLFKADGQGFFGELGHGALAAGASSKATFDSNGVQTLICVAKGQRLVVFLRLFLL
jgi:hypothetical protein